jgi:hypothetical protein
MYKYIYKGPNGASYIVDKSNNGDKVVIYSSRSRVLVIWVFFISDVSVCPSTYSTFTRYEYGGIQ